MSSTSFQRFAGLCAILSGLAILLYSVMFFLASQMPLTKQIPELLSALFQLLGGLLATAAFIGVYERLRGTSAAFALWATLLGMFGAVGSMVHGGYDLANRIHEPAQFINLPHYADPRGLLTFGVSGVAIFVIAWLMGQSRQFPQSLSTLGTVLGVALILIYLVRLIILDPSSPIIQAVLALTGLILNPGWYIWLGRELQRDEAAQPARAGARA
jgi:hypothetical protein